jgi:prepilin-type N-terminal cleavage/methylation domain-containing protein
MRKHEGFTLIEIIAVSVIVGILGMMTLPSFTKMLGRSYGLDALHNLIAIYSAQKNRSQNTGSYLVCNSGNTLVDFNCINDGLSLNIIASGGLVYACANDNTCSASGSATATAGKFVMKASLNNPINVTTNPVYCTATTPNYATYNPCCVADIGGAIGASGTNCPQ